jgi:hypothetical protein
MSRVIFVRLDRHETDPQYGGENPTYKDTKLRTAARRTLDVATELGIETTPFRETVEFETGARQSGGIERITLSDEERKRLEQWCERVRDAVESEIDADSIRQAFDALDDDERITDRVSERSYRYYRARGYVRGVIDICEYAAEHDCPVQVG